MLYNLIYRSKISNGLTDELLMELANKSNQANLDKGLSGLLLHNSTHFLQILEGPKEHIENLYQKIRKDPRHSEVVLIALEPIPLRLHSELGMKFINANNLDEIAIYLPTIYQDTELPTINSSYNSRTKKFINQFTDKNTSNSFFNLGKIKIKIDANKIKRSETLRIANAPNKNQFAFQPVVDIIQKRTFFVEALIRGPKGEKAEEYLANMNKDDLKIFDMHSTSDAIALATQLNIPNLSVNFNPKTLFETENIVDILEEMLSKYGFNNNQLIIEITEKDIISNYQNAFNTLTQLRASDIRIAVDDFGAGYSGLSLLADYQPDIIKVDRSIIANIHHSWAKQTIVKSIFNCADSMAISVCVEGLENEEDLQCLLEIGIKKFQGFLFGKPTINSYSEINFN